MSISNDTDPDSPLTRQRVATDPGLGAPRKAQTPAGSDGDPTPVLAPKGDDAPSRPFAMKPRTDPTPVPATTDMLLSGLIASESEAYFKKTKPAAESSGEAAVAFAAGPHTLQTRNPTPPPEPAILLRRSLEMDLVKGADKRDDPTPPTALYSGASGASSPPRRREPEPTEIDMPLRPGRPIWVERSGAFIAAALIVGAVGMLLFRWMAPHAQPSEATPFVAPPVQPSMQPSMQTSGAQPAAPAPRPPLVTTAMVQAPQAPVATPPETAPVKASSSRPVTAPRGMGPGPSRMLPPPDPGDPVPPPKDDVKRTL